MEEKENNGTLKYYQMSNIEKNVQELKDMLDNNEDFLLLDVRTENEVLVSKISDKSIHIPMNDIPNRLGDLDSNKEIIVYCKSGKRSAKVCEYLELNNYTNVKNLSGGILAWAEQIDSSILVY